MEELEEFGSKKGRAESNRDGWFKCYNYQIGKEKDGTAFSKAVPSIDQDPPLIIIHSSNTVARNNMFYNLKDRGYYNTHIMDFVSMRKPLIKVLSAD